MATDPIITPTLPVLRICDSLDRAIARFLEEKLKLRIGTYEAEVESMLIFNLGIRHVEGLIALARNDLVLLPAAFHLGRAALECCVRAAWMVNDPDPMQREARWLAHLGGEISAVRRSSDRLEAAGMDVQEKRGRADTLQAFRDDVAGSLSARGVPLLKQLPNFEQMLSSVGGKQLYATYIEASQYTHGGHAATWLYRSDGVGTEKRIGENVQAQHWILPLRMCWLALSHPGEVVIARVAPSASAPFSRDLSDAMDVAFQDLASGRPDHIH